MTKDELIASQQKEREHRLCGWRLIETAPLDGSHVQLYRPRTQFTGYYGGANSGWRINAPGLPAMWPLPTHWRPLFCEPKDT
jgi:hypothetical protein